MSDATQDYMREAQERMSQRRAAREMPNDGAFDRIIAEETDAAIDARRREVIGELKEPSIVLTGDEMAAYDAFALAAAKVEAQAEVMQKANADYRAALERVSQHAARRNRPR